MTSYCTSCSSPIPDGQGSSCSMCYGDIEYGRDGYYREWAEEKDNSAKDFMTMEQALALDEEKLIAMGAYDKKEQTQ